MKICVIVDGYSSGRFYAKKLSTLGYSCLHVKSSPHLSACLAGCYGADNYISSCIHENIKITLDWISSFGIPDFIIPGMESGVSLADQLSSTYGLVTSNGISKSPARRNKFLMMELVAAFGMRSIKQLKTNQRDHAISWIQENKIPYPIVVKPLESAGGDGFSLCRSDSDVKSAFDKALYKKNIFNVINNDLLIQEFISGKEYVVDTVSLGGKHVVTDFLSYEKEILPDGTSVYKSCRFLPKNFGLSSILSEYAFGVLNALGIQNGPAHTEIIINDAGPVLIETGARLPGCHLDTELIREAYGHTQLDLSILAYTNPNDFFDVSDKLSNSMFLNFEIIYLSSNDPGVVMSVDTTSIEKLETFKKVVVNVSVGETIAKVDNFSKHHVAVYLQHKNSDAIEADKKKLMEIERNGFIKTDAFQQDENVNFKPKVFSM